MTAYVVAHITIRDRERYQQYEAGFMEIFAKYEGTMLSVDEQPELLEGEWDATRTVLISFPSSTAAHDWIDSEAYQNLAQHRFAAAESHVVLLQGLG